MNCTIWNLILLKKTNYPCYLSISKQCTAIQSIDTETVRLRIDWYSTALNLRMYMRELVKPK